MTNLFRQAKQLLDKKDSGGELTEEELGLVNTAIIPLMVRTHGVFPEDITIAEGLEELARLVEGRVAESRGRAVGSSSGSLPGDRGFESHPRYHP